VLLFLLQAYEHDYIARKFYSSKKEKEVAVYPLQHGICVAWVQELSLVLSLCQGQAQDQVCQLGGRTQKAADEEKAKKQCELQIANHECAGVESKIKSLEETLKTLKSTLNSKKAHYDELQDNFDKADEERCKLKKNIDELESNIQDKVETISDVEVSIKELRTKMDSLEKFRCHQEWL